MSAVRDWRYKNHGYPLRPSRLHHFEAMVLDTIRRRALVRPGARVLVAASGGPDSTALLAALTALRDAGALASVHACHVDHQLRASSVEDGAHCAELCSRLGVPLERAQVKVSGASGVQAAARRARYAALRTAAARCGADRIATGHTVGDQAETLAHRLLRGAGARGLAGIPPRRGAVIRPLIDRSRREVLAYLRERGLTWRDDPTNASPRFLRNRIRAELVPVLEALAPGAVRRMARAADLLRDDDTALERLAAGVAPAGARRIDVAALRGVPLAVRRRVVRRLWRAATGSRRGLGADHVEAVLRLVRAKGPRRLALGGGVEARARYGALELGPAEPAAAALAPVPVNGPGTYPLPGRAAVVAIAWSSGDPAPWPLELRTRRPGDRFRPERGRGGKKLKSWLIDRKIPRSRRDALVVLADAGGRVLWLPELGARAAGTGALHVEWQAAPGKQAGA